MFIWVNVRGRKRKVRPHDQENEVQTSPHDGFRVLQIFVLTKEARAEQSERGDAQGGYTGPQFLQPGEKEETYPENGARTRVERIVM